MKKVLEYHPSRPALNEIGKNVNVIGIRISILPKTDYDSKNGIDSQQCVRYSTA